MDVETDLGTEGWIKDVLMHGGAEVENILGQNIGQGLELAKGREKRRGWSAAQSQLIMITITF